MWVKNVILAGGIGVTLVAGTRTAPPAPEPEGSVTGRVIVVGLDRITSPSIFVLVDESKGGEVPDGRVDRVFRLQVKSEYAFASDADYARARVSWTRNEVKLSSGDGVLRTFGLTNAKTESKNAVRGHGMVHTRAWRLSLTRNASIGRDFDALRLALRALDETCNVRSGGEGAFACSVSGCSGTPSSCNVSCPAGGTAYCGCYATSGKACCFCADGKAD